MPHYLPQRSCLHCAEPLIGRADKKFCDNSCKAHYNRALTAPTASTPLPPLFSDETVLALALTAHSPWKVLNEHYQEDGSEEYMNRYERVRDYQERGDALYADYAAIVEGLLCCQYDGITSTSYNEGLKQVERTFLSYFQHPGLCTPGHIAHQRLADLQFVHVLLQSLQKQAAAIEAKTLYAPGVKPKRPLHYDFLSKRQLQHLWANLLGVP